MVLLKIILTFLQENPVPAGDLPAVKHIPSAQQAEIPL